MTLSQANALAASPGAILRDDKVAGLQLRVFEQGRAFYLHYRFKGQERRPKLGSFPTMSITAAREIAKDWLNRVARGEDPSSKRRAERLAPTVSQLCDVYLAHVDPPGGRARKSRKSIYEDRRNMDRFLRPKLGAIKVADLRVLDVKDLHAGLSRTPYQANRVLALLSVLCAFAENLELRPVGSNPTAAVDRYPERKRKRYMTREEAGAVTERLRFYEGQYPRQAAFLWLQIYTGARPDEIARLRAEDVQGAKVVLREHKTASTGDDRVIQLPPQAAALMAKLERPLKGRPLLGIKSPRHLWLKIMADTGIEGLRPYDMRHTFASIGLSNGKTLAQIGELLGHRSTATTSRYAHLIDEKAQQDATEIADAFDVFSRPKLVVVK